MSLAGLNNKELQVTFVQNRVLINFALPNINLLCYTYLEKPPVLHWFCQHRLQLSAGSCENVVYLSSDFLIRSLYVSLSERHIKISLKIWEEVSCLIFYSFLLIVSFDVERIAEVGKNKGILQCHVVSKAFH